MRLMQYCTFFKIQQRFYCNSNDYYKTQLMARGKKILDKYSTEIDPGEPNDYMKYHQMRLDRAELYKNLQPVEEIQVDQNKNIIEPLGENVEDTSKD